jgi:REP-associated tyrosine transposase
VHVTLRVRRDVPNLRTRARYLAIRAATRAAARRDGFRLVHISIQHDHVHLIVEARDRVTLARGMQSFQISAARQLNCADSRRGKVFADRYHAHVLCSPREVRRALGYVLNNWRKHGEDQHVAWRIDPFSSAISFARWADARGAFEPPPGHRVLIVSPPSTWLLANGWERHGLVATTEIPGAR